jgi:hypothetical protein
MFFGSSIILVLRIKEEQHKRPNPKALLAISPKGLASAGVQLQACYQNEFRFGNPSRIMKNKCVVTLDQIIGACNNSVANLVLLISSFLVFFCFIRFI